jgi:phosphoheptose isomerase
MTAWSNDTSYDDIFVEQLKNLVNSGDLIIGISVSGNSENVVRAMQYAKAVGCYVIAWTGIGGGKMGEISDLSVIVESDQYGPVEDVHLILNHILHAWISEELASRNA